MDIQKEREALIAEIERFKEEAMKSYVVSCWAESYTNTDPFGYVILENENNKVWWMKTQAHQLWQFWQAAKAQAVPEGFVLVNKKDLVKVLNCVTDDWLVDTDSFEEFKKIESLVQDEVNAMIEAQEQKG